MSDWFSTAVEMQREIVRAQQAQMDAGADMLEASEKAAKAQVSAWKAWARLWGWGK
ncbi:hypothetical protein [Sphingomonas baiyangensis]|uniref:hypothetical protein n=1 Tax=Sphingomonas baiyangensis TaxID=2572576 RepID=UPI00146E1271|nr:hypothetical protein [Sphingomonas baiyangensis]